jgi:TonB family protein
MPEAGELLQGRIVGGKFHLSRYLGGSEHSAVFLTERPQGSPRTAAIKLMPADPATADLQLSRWKLIARLSHPHVLQIFEAGRCTQEGEEFLYVVMEYAEENLAQILPERALTPAETQEMLKPTLEALAYLHGRGFVHGHLKPANMLVAGEQLKLSSDGLCRIGETGGAEAGPYAAPELPGTAAAPPRDVWSLGVTLVQVLTRLLPVRNGGDGPQSGVTLPEALPAQFVDLAHNCLQPDPGRRCTLAEIAEHLHYKLPSRTLGPPQLPPQPAIARTPPRPAPRRELGGNRSVLQAAAIVLILAGVFGGWNLLNRKASSAETQPAAVESPDTTPSSVPAAALERPSAEPRAMSKAPAAAPLGAEPLGRATLKTASEVRGSTPAASLKPRASASPGGPIAPGEVLQQVLPEVPRGASNTIRGTVRVTVRIRVDPAGNVAGVNVVSSGPSAYFARKAADAARQWKFSPAHRDGQAAASAWNVRFEFIRGGVRVFPSPVL